MKILLVFRAPVGGLFKHVFDLSEALFTSGHEIAVVFDSSSDVDSDKLDLLHRFCSEGVFRTPISRNPSLLDFVPLFKIYCWSRGKNFQVIHGHGAKGGFVARILKIFHKKSAVSIYTPHGGVLHYSPKTLKGFVFIQIEKLLLYLSDGVIFESNFAKFQFAKLIAAPLCQDRVIYNGLSNSECCNVELLSNPVDFIYLGELRRLKGVDVFLRALKILQDRGIICSALLFGGGPDRDAFIKLGESLRLENISWMGVSPNAKYAFERGRCVVVPSLAESFPYVVLEAAAMSKPIIATRVGGIPEILVDRKSWPTVGDPFSLADEMELQLRGISEANSSIADIACYVRLHFSKQKMSNEVLNFYSLLAGKNNKEH